MPVPATSGTERGSLQAFFQESYLKEHPEDQGNIDKLKDLIAWQVPPVAPRQQPWPGEPHDPSQTRTLFSCRPRCWQRGSGSTSGR